MRRSKTMTGLTAPIKDRPLRFIGPTYLSADLTLMAASGVAHDKYMLAASGLGAITNILFTVGGDGGDQAKRSERQKRKAAWFERTGLVSTTISGGLYVAAGLSTPAEPNVSLMMVGAFGGSGALIGLFGRQRTSRSKVAARRKNLVDRFVDNATELTPYQKASLIWTASSTMLVPTMLERQDPLMLLSICLYFAANRLVYMSNKAQPQSMGLSKLSVRNHGKRIDPH